MVCSTCAADTYQPATGQSACLACSTCLDGDYAATTCTTTTDAVCSACDGSCLTCDGPTATDCTSCSATRQLVAGTCQSLCGTAPNPSCLPAAQAKLQADEKTAGKEKLQLQWKKIAPATTRASFGDPVTGNTVAVACVFDDGGAFVGEYLVDRGSQTCDGKPCWKLTGKEGYAYSDKTASASGIAKMKFAGGDPNKGQAAAQGKNDAGKGLSSLPTGLVGALTGNTAPTIELVTNDGLCVGATMNKVTKDEGGQYKAQRK